MLQSQKLSSAFFACDNPMTDFAYLKFSLEKGICRISLDRPDLHNAFNRALIEEIHAAFVDVADRPTVDVRAVVLSGQGKSFCAGADVNWMRESLQYSKEENVADALRMASMF